MYTLISTTKIDILKTYGELKITRDNIVQEYATHHDHWKHEISTIVIKL